MKKEKKAHLKAQLSTLKPQVMKGRKKAHLKAQHSTVYPQTISRILAQPLSHAAASSSSLSRTRRFRSLRPRCIPRRHIPALAPPHPCAHVPAAAPMRPRPRRQFLSRISLPQSEPAAARARRPTSPVTSARLGVRLPP